jgi:hypothetical protein
LTSMQNHLTLSFRTFFAYEGMLAASGARTQPIALCQPALGTS